MAQSKEALPPLKIHLPCDVSVHPRVPDGCFKFNMIVTRDTAWAAFKMYGALFLFTSLIRGKGLSPRAVLTRLLPSTLRSAAFLGVFASLYGAGNCLHVNLLGANLQLPYFMSAFFAAFFSILVEHRSRRSELMLYTCNVAAEAAFNMLVHRGWLKPVKNGIAIIFAVSWSILLAMYRHSQEDMDSVKAAVSAMMVESQIQKNPVLQSSIGIVRGALIGLILKGGLTAVSLAGKPHKIKKLTFWKREGKLIFKMAFFLSVLSGGSRALVALIRKLRGGVDSPVNSAVAGLIAGSASIMYGNIEVSMYLASKAANALVQLALRKAQIPTPPLGAAFMYALATATIFYQSAFEPHNLRPSYWKFLVRVTNGHIHHFGVLAADYRRELGIPGPSHPVAPLKK